MCAIKRAVSYFISTAVAFGAAPVARVISTQPLEVGGITSPARNFVPVAVGEAVATHEASAVLQFRDGSNVVLQPNSQLRLEGQQARPTVHVVSGSARYTLSSNSKIQVVNTKGEMVSNALTAAMAQVSALSAANNPANPLAAAVVYRASAAPPGSFVSPVTPYNIGSFAFSKADPTATTGTITTPTGVVFTVTPTTVNGQTVYSIASITYPTAGGGTTTVTSGDLIGATITLGPTPGGNTNTLTITDDGVVLTPLQANQALQAEAPANVQTTGAAVIGQFSPTAP